MPEEAVGLQPGWKTEEEELANRGQKWKKERNPTSHTSAVGEEAYLGLKMSLPPPRAAMGTSSRVQVLIAAGLIIAMEGGLGFHPAC